MSTIRVAPIDNPANSREVAQSSWKHWPQSKEVSGGRMAGKDIYVEVTDAMVAKATAPKTPTVPPEVQAMKDQNNGEKAKVEPTPVPVTGKKK